MCKCLLGGGYFGNRQTFFVNGVEEILRKIQSIYDIPNTGVYLIGSSAGGFASLHICARNDGYKCLVRNPQIFLGASELGTIGNLWQLDFSEPCYKERLELGDSIVRNKTSRFYMFFNRCSDWDLGNLRQLLTKFGVSDMSRNYYHFGNKHIVVMETDIEVPHNNHCCAFPATIFARMDLIPPDDLEHVLLSLLNANQERCGLQDSVRHKDGIIANLKKQIEEREENLRQTAIRDLWTARLDIKNYGSNNEVIVSNLLEDYPIDITKPSWFKNEDGQGILIEGRTGFARLKLHCIGTGILKIDLRGITKLGVYKNRLPYWITYHSLSINGHNILKQPVDVWHDKPVTCSKHVQDGENMILEIRWHPCNKGV